MAAVFGSSDRGYLQSLAPRQVPHLQLARPSSIPTKSGSVSGSGVGVQLPGPTRPGGAIPPAYSPDIAPSASATSRRRDQGGGLHRPKAPRYQRHYYSDPKSDPKCEPLDQNQPAGSPGFFAGNCKFITRKLWDFYNQGRAFMHHGKFTTAREAVEAHNGEALTQREAFDALSTAQQNQVIEFLKSLQVLPPNARSPVVDEDGNPKHWPPSPDSSQDQR